MSDVYQQQWIDLEEYLNKISNCSFLTKEVEEYIEEAEILIDLLDIESHVYKNRNRVKDYRKSLNEEKFRLYFKQDSTVISQNERKESSLDLLRKANQQLKETEEIGRDTLYKLEEQKSQIKEMKKSLCDTNENLSYSNKLLNKLKKWWRG